MKIVSEKISLQELDRLAGDFFGDMIKAVVDVERKVIAINAELHADLESYLLSEGSRQEHLWGINLYPKAGVDDFIEFDSMINVRPGQGNRSRGVESETIRKKIVDIVNQRIIL